MKKCSILAPAKINLFLDVGPAGPDGYHTICSIMQTVSLCDLVTTEKIPAGINLSCPEVDLPCDERNIAYRAAQAFFRESNIKDAGQPSQCKRESPLPAALPAVVQMQVQCFYCSIVSLNVRSLKRHFCVLVAASVPMFPFV